MGCCATCRSWITATVRWNGSSGWTNFESKCTGSPRIVASRSSAHGGTPHSCRIASTTIAITSASSPTISVPRSASVRARRFATCRTRSRMPASSAYQFALGDTLVLTTPKGRVRVVSIQVRPSHPDSAGTVGTLFLDLDRAALVRFRFTFTPASYRDPTVQTITRRARELAPIEHALAAMASVHRDPPGAAAPRFPGSHRDSRRLDDRRLPTGRPAATGQVRGSLHRRAASARIRGELGRPDLPLSFERPARRRRRCRRGA